MIRTKQPQDYCLAAPITTRAYGFLLGLQSPDMFNTGTSISYSGTVPGLGATGVTRVFSAAGSNNGTFPTPGFVDASKPWAAIVVFKCISTGVTQKLAVWTSGTTHIALHLSTTLQLSVVSGTSGSPSPKVTTIALTSGATYRVCLGYDGTSWFIYINGADGSSTIGVTVTLATAGTLTYIGSRQDATAFFNGDLTLFVYIQGRVDGRSLSANPWQLFTPQRVSTPAALVSLPTLGRPATDTITGSWTSSSTIALSGAINEVSPSDAEYISVTTGSTCEMVLDNTAYPGGGVQTLSYRASSANSSNLTVTLKQGGTTIMTRTHALTPTITLYTQTLNSGEIATIIAGAISVTLTSS